MSWVTKLLDSLRDPHLDAATSMHRTNAVKELVDQVAAGRRPDPQRVREVREMLDRDDALTNLFGAPPSTRRNGR